jgi:hypothetical protein
LPVFPEDLYHLALFPGVWDDALIIMLPDWLSPGSKPYEGQANPINRNRKTVVDFIVLVSPRLLF